MARSINEEWKSIPGYEPYEASNLGRIRRQHGNHFIIIKPEITKDGYESLTICKGNMKSARRVHRLVALAFIDNPDNKPYINHIDNNPLNNCVENLEWCTQKENIEWMIKQGRKAPAKSSPVVGTNIKTGQKIFFKSMRSAGQFGFNAPHIYECCCGKRKKHLGYTWEAIDEKHYAGL